MTSSKAIRQLKMLVGDDPSHEVLAGFLAQYNGVVVEAANGYIAYRESKAIESKAKEAAKEAVKEEKEGIIDLDDSDEEDVQLIGSKRSSTGVSTTKGGGLGGENNRNVVNGTNTGCHIGNGGGKGMSSTAASTTTSTRGETNNNNIGDNNKNNKNNNHDTTASHQPTPHASAVDDAPPDQKLQKKQKPPPRPVIDLDLSQSTEKSPSPIAREAVNKKRDLTGRPIHGSSKDKKGPTKSTKTPPGNPSSSSSSSTAPAPIKSVKKEETHVPTKVKPAAQRSFVVPIGSVTVRGWSTVSLRSNSHFRINDVMGPALRSNLPCDLDISLTGFKPREIKQFKVSNGAPMMTTTTTTNGAPSGSGSEENDYHNASRVPLWLLPGHCIIRFSIDGVGEIGSIPSNIARYLAPLMVERVLHVTCRLPSGNDEQDGGNNNASSCLPLTLDMGTEIPLILTCAFTNRAFESTRRRDEKENEVLRSCWNGLFRLLKVPRLRGDTAANIAKAVETLGNVKEEEGAEDTMKELKNENSSEKDGTNDKVKEDKKEAQGGSVPVVEIFSDSDNNEVMEIVESSDEENIDAISCDDGELNENLQLNEKLTSFEKSSLPKMTPPNEKLHLRDYQKQCLYFMWRRENPNAQAPASCVTGPSVTTHDESLNPPREYLNLMWEERSVPSCVIKDETGRRDGDEGEKRTISSFFFHAGTGQLSLEFPDKCESCRGGILADEMGLGKTVMTLALISLDYAPNLETARTVAEVPRYYIESLAKVPKLDGVGSLKPAGTLIVAPVSLLKQWEAEWEKYIGGGVFQYHGGTRSRDPAILRKYEVVLTTYGTLSSSSGEVLTKIFWRRIILDEAHVIKGRITRVAKRAFELNGWSKWCITGTPMQNSIDDIYPLVRFIKAEPYSIYQIWRKVISNPLADGYEEAALKALRGILDPLLIRRMKESKDDNGKAIVSLPPRETKIIWIQLTMEERERYDHVYRISRDKAYQLMATGGSTYTHILALITKLRMLLCHVSLGPSTLSIPKENTNVEVPNCPLCGDTAVDPIETICSHVLCLECAHSAHRRLRGVCPVCLREKALTIPFQRLGGTDITSMEITDEDDFTPSSKMNEMLKMVQDDICAGIKVLVFSQWTGFLAIIRRMFSEEDIPYRQLDGTQSMEQRSATSSWLEKHEGGCALIISLKAGGVGLNLISATKVYMMDLWWNPAIEEQAFQRVHRIGQEKPVHCFKMVVKDSMDERVLRLQEKKRHLINGAMQQNVRITMEDLRELWME